MQALRGDGDAEQPTSEVPPAPVEPAVGRETPVSSAQASDRSGSKIASRRGTGANQSSRGAASSPEELAERLAEDPAFAAVREVFPGRVLAIESAASSGEEGPEVSIVTADDLDLPEDE